MSEASAVILVEGISDRAAVEALAKRLGRDLESERVSVVAMGGASLIEQHLLNLRLEQPQATIAGLCDEAEEADFKRALEVTGRGANLSRPAMADLGFHVCIEDLEDELIRAIGPDEVERLIELQGDRRSLHSMQNQPAWRGRPKTDQLRRFFGAGAGRKTRYARVLVEAADIDRVPSPLMGVLESV